MDFTPEEIRYMLDTAHDLKRKKNEGIFERHLEGKNIALIFEKTSTRTRCSFEVVCQEEGANVTFIDPSSSHFGKKRNPWRIRLRYWAGFSMGSNTGDSGRR